MTRGRPNRHTAIAVAVASCFLAATASAGWSDLFKKGESFFSGESRNKGGNLTEFEITRGLKEALQIGSARVIKQVGRVDGYNDDPEIHISLPRSLRSVQYALRTAGVPDLLDDLELRLNRAAEVAAPKAKYLFYSAIRQMTLLDVRRIYNGRDDAATRYFQKSMTPGLTDEMRPVVDSSLSQVGAIRAYDKAMTLYNNIPIAPKVNPDLTGYVVEKGIEGIFYYLAKEEAEIRKNPVKRTTEILRKVFGGA
jgi:hypothetical protein